MLPKIPLVELSLFPETSFPSRLTRSTHQKSILFRAQPDAERNPAISTCVKMLSKTAMQTGPEKAFPAMSRAQRIPLLLCKKFFMPGKSASKIPCNASTSSQRKMDCDQHLSGYISGSDPTPGVCEMNFTNFAKFR